MRNAKKSATYSATAR